MRERLIFTFLFHLFGISLFLIPNKYQGPIVAAVSGIRLRALDAIALILLFSGTVFLFTSLIIQLKLQVKEIKQQSNNGVGKSE